MTRSPKASEDEFTETKLAEGERSLVRPRGFEPLAYSFGDCRSIQLSYGRTF